METMWEREEDVEGMSKEIIELRLENFGGAIRLDFSLKSMDTT